ncbi:MAG: beta-aspartyl-peptidase [Bacilli bacterium]
MYLIKNIDIYNPNYIGKKDILFSKKIEAIEDEISIELQGLKIIDGSGKKLLPGFIDNHVHITGGGGEGSFKTRVPESMLGDFTSCGITTVGALLGTDGTTRSVENLIAKAKALKEEGLSVFCYTGSYEIPTVTLTGSIKKDIIFIDEVIGVKIAMSDHRSSMLTKNEFARVSSEARVAGMLSGKSGSVCIHMGDHENGLEFLLELIAESALPIKIFRPTHVSRNEKLFDDAIKFAKLGGYIDITAGNNPIESVVKTIENGVDQSLITISSDGFGSYSDYDEKGELIKIGVQSVDVLYSTFKKLVNDASLDVQDALKYFTTNPANALGISKHKGYINIDKDSDLIIVDKSLNINYVFANGKMHVENSKQIIFGTYEK